MKGFSLREYLEGDTRRNQANNGTILEIAAVWAQNNRHRSIRDFVPLIANGPLMG